MARIFRQYVRESQATLAGDPEQSRVLGRGDTRCASRARECPPVGARGLPTWPGRSAASDRRRLARCAPAVVCGAARLDRVERISCRSMARPPHVPRHLRIARVPLEELFEIARLGPRKLESLRLP